MTYSGADTARDSRESLGKALEALQQDADIPDDVMAVAQNIAQAVGALFEAEKSSSEIDGKACVKNALGTLSQTLALLQDVRSAHPGVEVATERLAKTMSALYPLTTVPSRMPPPGGRTPSVHPPKMAGLPSVSDTVPERPQMPASSGPKLDIEANIGATTESNFFVGFSGEISEGGVFLSTYEVLAQGTHVRVLVTLPGGFDFTTDGWVRFVRDPFDLESESDPGMGIQFVNLDANSRELVLRFVRKRPPTFYDD